MSGGMRQHLLLALAAGALLAAPARLAAAEDESGFIALCDGRTFAGWKTAEENKDTWKVEDGAFVAHGGLARARSL